MSKRNKSRSRFTGHTRTTISRNLTAAPQATPSRYYSRITELPLCKFIDCIVDENLHALVISGDPTPAELSHAWADILRDYSHKSGSTEYLTWFRLFKELHTINANITMAEECVRILNRMYVKKFADRLNDVLNQYLTFDITNIAEYDRMVQVSWNKIAGLRLQREMLNARFKAIDDTQKDKKPVTREYYLSLLITLSDVANYPISDQITVFEFCERMERANKAAKAANARK
jgi:hypothetical protein